MVSSMALKHRKLFPFFTETNQTHCPDFCDPTCPYGCYPYPNFYFMPPPLPPPPPPPPLSADQILQVSPYVIVIVSMLAIFCLLVSYYLIIVKYCSSWNRFRPPPTQSDGQDEEFLEENRGPPIDHHIWYISTVGLQPSIINSITVFKYKKGDRLIEGTECSVCLSEFQEGETLRLLPKCNHAFHIPCIDTWLRSHTNCPLCRAGIVSNTASTPSASNGQISFNMTQEEHTQMENLESDGELAINWANDCEVCENRAELPHVHDERKEINDSKDGDNSNENGVVEDNDTIMEDEIQSVRQSASMDSSSTETLSLAVANFSMVESVGNLIDHREGAQKSHLGIVQKQDFTNLRMNRVVGSS